MADQQRVRDAEPVEQDGEHVERLLMHEARRVRGDEAIRLAIAEARVDERSCTEASRHFVGEVAPQRVVRPQRAQRLESP